MKRNVGSKALYLQDQRTKSRNWFLVYTLFIIKTIAGVYPEVNQRNRLQG